MGPNQALVESPLKEQMAPERAEPGLPRRCAEAVRSANASLAEDDRLETVMLPVADGLTIARRR